MVYRGYSEAYPQQELLLTVVYPVAFPARSTDLPVFLCTLIDAVEITHFPDPDFH